MFEELEVNQLIEWSKVDETFTIVLKENKKTKLYTFPFGKEEFALKMEEYEKGSYKEIIRFIDFCYELYDAVM